VSSRSSNRREGWAVLDTTPTPCHPERSGLYREEPKDLLFLLIEIAKALGVTIGYLLIVVALLSFLEPQGWGWTLATTAAGLAATTAALLVGRNVAKRKVTTIFGEKREG
jgi:hypothetical protein